jgi:hypothetical protein
MSIEDVRQYLKQLEEEDKASSNDSHFSMSDIGVPYVPPSERKRQPVPIQSSSSSDDNDNRKPPPAKKPPPPAVARAHGSSSSSSDDNRKPPAKKPPPPAVARAHRSCYSSDDDEDNRKPPAKKQGRTGHPPQLMMKRSQLMMIIMKENLPPKVKFSKPYWASAV